LFTPFCARCYNRANTEDRGSPGSGGDSGAPALSPRVREESKAAERGLTAKVKLEGDEFCLAPTNRGWGLNAQP
jgi:hypothetical protein